VNLEKSDFPSCVRSKTTFKNADPQHRLNAWMTVAKAVRPMANAVLYADRLHVAAGENYVLANIAQSAAYRVRVVDQGQGKGTICGAKQILAAVQ
jgi:hypothetical protein